MRWMAARAACSPPETLPARGDMRSYTARQRGGRGDVAARRSNEFFLEVSLLPQINIRSASPCQLARIVSNRTYLRKARVKIPDGFHRGSFRSPNEQLH